MTFLLAASFIVLTAVLARGSDGDPLPWLEIKGTASSSTSMTTALQIHNPITNGCVCGLYYTTNFSTLTNWTRLPYCTPFKSNLEVLMQPSASGFFRIGLTAIRPGFGTNYLYANDDGSTGYESIGFPINYYGTTREGLYINNNGNVTFDRSLSSYTPSSLTNLLIDIIAPFWADIDTQAQDSQVLTYSQGSVDGCPAFFINWVSVGYYSSKHDKANSFQMVFIQRADRGVGDFDLEFNYASVEWETGDMDSPNRDGLGGHAARIGFSSGKGGFYEFAGSGTPGAFLDSCQERGLIYHSFNSAQSGRYVFRFHDGQPLELPSQLPDN